MNSIHDFGADAAVARKEIQTLKPTRAELAAALAP